ncbi:MULTISPECIES: 3-thiaglutamate biosynthesis pearlin carrier peptide TglA [Pseudomonas]|uniref:Uncharacterized protein n=8 Tax=Pseudomonas TaxID=286 RepID=A0A3M3RQW4_PSECA|nr:MULTISPECIES: TglA family RiPP precursor [Pseudomonas]KPB68832.1 Uncharacterized protein AC507_1871 [Pseudomonas syringae pv. maculicola]KPW26896.1 Uncharacterized protein ALO83_01288 [Pseudomonas cannabina pv. alisalensis]MBM0139391.1 hypothetical protein [Pseudomonas cannabina pv. alisalensis]MDU8431323.1 TglA family RiPP precursor [Pseudomonas syringae pv. actinidifoliorum]MDU8523944.1 TglA family RiPP precursor [Pseudomonas syringae pv. actinidifoliorum]
MGQPNVQSVENQQASGDVKDLENTPQATEEALFEEFDLDDIEVIESKVFA